MTKIEVKTFCPTHPQQWRAWLQENHMTEKSVWVIFYKNKTNTPTITWSDAVDEALCFGWIDGIVKPVDEERFMRFFTKRKPNSVWSAINKEKLQKLIAEGKITKAGLDSIETAKQNGSWAALDDVDALIIPADLERALQTRPHAKDHFLNWSKSDKKYVLYWVLQARRPETRQKRIAEIVALAEQNLKPKVIQWTKKLE